MRRITKVLPMRRRRFIQGALGAGLLHRSIFSYAGQRVLGSARINRAVYHDMPYMDFTGHGAVYRPPKGNASTKRVLQSLTSEQQFLLRSGY